MDDFYDTDIGVQTSDILVLPSAFLGTLWTELQSLGNDKTRKIISRLKAFIAKVMTTDYKKISKAYYVYFLISNFLINIFKKRKNCYSLSNY